MSINMALNNLKENASSLLWAIGFHCFWCSLGAKIDGRLSCARVIQNVLSLPQKEWQKQNSFSQFFSIVPLDINAFGPVMFKQCNLVMEEGSVLVHPTQTPPHHR